jgi:hypothetical protein
MKRLVKCLLLGVLVGRLIVAVNRTRTVDRLRSGPVLAANRAAD